jgi:WD40 repeat protein
MSWLERFTKGQKPLPGTVEPVRGETIARSAVANPHAALRFKPGEEVAGNLQIKQLLGRGGMGAVWLARQIQWDVDVAVKIPSSELLADSENRHRIAREAEAWTDLGLHPHIAYCHYAQPLGDSLLLVIEYVDGGNLRDWIATGRCTEMRTGLDLAIQFCHGLERAHSLGLVHRDIKPENILITKAGTLKITDFGIVGKVLPGVDALRDDLPRATPTAAMTTVIGTHDYMAPEQFVDGHTVDTRADVFGFGLCLYEMFCGRRPYETAVGPRQVAPEPDGIRGGSLPDGLAELMKRSVAWDWEGRPSITDIRTALCGLYEQEFGEPSQHAELLELPVSADDWNNRALSYLALGRQDDAENAWSRALEVDPAHVDSVYNRGLQQWRSAKTTDQDVVVALRDIVENSADAWLPRYLLAQVHVERGDTEEAKKELAQVNSDSEQPPEMSAVLRAAAEMPAMSRVVRTFGGDAKGFIQSVCLSPDGKHALSGSEDKTVKFWELESGHCVRTFAGHTDKVNSVCLSADRRLAVSASDDRTLRVWEVAEGRCIRTLEGHQAAVESARFRVDGRFVISASSDKTLMLWDLATGERLRMFEGHTSGVTSVTLSREGEHALSGSSKGTLSLWEVGTGRCLRTYEGHEGRVASVCLSEDMKFALSGGWDDLTLKLWEVESGRCLRTFRGHTNYVTSVDWRGSAKLALSSSFDETIRLWDVGSGRCLRTLVVPETYLAACLSANGQAALSAGHRGKMQHWVFGALPSMVSFRLSRAVASEDRLSHSVEYENALSKATRAIGAGDAPEASQAIRKAREQPGHRRAPAIIRKWADLYRKLPKRSLEESWSRWRVFEYSDAGPRASVSSVCLTPDGRHLLTAADELKLWETASGRCVRTFENSSSSLLVSSCLSSDGLHIVSGGWDGKITLWERETGRCQRTLEAHQKAVNTVSF